MKIALYGIGGLYNYGCEAIVRGTVAIIKSLDSDIKITYYSPCAAQDRQIIEDVDVDVLQIEKNNSLFVRLINKMFRIFKIPYQAGQKHFKEIIGNNDCIFSIGGDIYTIPRHLRDKDRYYYYRNVVQLGESAVKANGKLIIFGASIGPFGDYKAARNYFFSHLRHVSLIIAREQRCIDYLRENGVNTNVCFMPDPAFAVQLVDTIDSKQEYIGINFSPLSVYELFGAVSKQAVDHFAKVLCKVYDVTKTRILLIPHVINQNSEMDNDLWLFEKIMENVSEEIRPFIEISSARSFMEVKRELHKCHIVISARMHCAVNAVCECIPTLFLAYSEKACGMAQYIYRDEDFCLPLDIHVDDLVEKIVDLLNKKDSVRNFLNKRIPEIREEIKAGEGILQIARVIDR